MKVYSYRKNKLEYLIEEILVLPDKKDGYDRLLITGTMVQKLGKVVKG